MNTEQNSLVQKPQRIKIPEEIQVQKKGDEAYLLHEA